MTRSRDRWQISEAVRLNNELWRYEWINSESIMLHTSYDERLYIRYGKAGQIAFAYYTHFDRDTGMVAWREDITQGKRKRVLELLNQKDVA